MRSPVDEALPLVMTHGWPGSVVEFLEVIGPLTDPEAHGGAAGDAFHVVCPSLPGYAFSDKPTTTGWGVERTATAWTQLMARLGYNRYGAQGGDWGSAVTSCIAAFDPSHLVGIHLNMIAAGPGRESGDLTEEEQSALDSLKHHEEWGTGYSKEQSTRPQTIGYSLADSPVGQCAWILEKFWSWTDTDGDPVGVLGADRLLDNIMLYWLTGSGASAARLYWESFRGGDPPRLRFRRGSASFPRRSPAHRGAGPSAGTPTSCTGTNSIVGGTSRRSSSLRPSWSNSAPPSGSCDSGS